MEQQNVNYCGRDSQLSSCEYYMHHGCRYFPEFCQQHVNHHPQDLFLNQVSLPDNQRYCQSATNHVLQNEQYNRPFSTAYCNFNNLEPIGATLSHYQPCHQYSPQHNQQVHNGFQPYRQHQFLMEQQQQQFIWPTMRQPCPVLHPTLVASQVYRSHQPQYQHDVDNRIEADEKNEENEESEVSHCTDDGNSNEDGRQEEEYNDDGDGDDENDDKEEEEEEEEEEQQQQQHQQFDFISPNNVFTEIDTETGANLDLVDIKPTVKYLNNEENLKNDAGWLSYAIGNEQNVPPRMQPRGSSTFLLFFFCIMMFVQVLIIILILLLRFREK